VFGQIGGYDGKHGKPCNGNVASLKERIEDFRGEPTVFHMIPFNEEFSTGVEFSDILASRFRRLEDAIAERRIAADCVSAIESKANPSFDILTSKDMGFVWNDVRYAVELLFSDDRILHPVKRLWETNQYYGIHCVDVSIGTISLAAGIPGYAGNKDAIVAAGIAGLLHDIGKEMYPELYTKIGRFTEKDHEMMIKHPLDSVSVVKGALKVLPASMQERVIYGIEQHHENWDGSGYPYGLRGEQISSEAQVIRIADSMEAGTSPVRSAIYNGLPKSQAAIMADIAGKSGIWYNPAVVAVLQKGFDDYINEQGTKAPNRGAYHA